MVPTDISLIKYKTNNEWPNVQTRQKQQKTYVNKIPSGFGFV